MLNLPRQITGDGQAGLRAGFTMERRTTPIQEEAGRRGKKGSAEELSQWWSASGQRDGGRSEAIVVEGPSERGGWASVPAPEKDRRGWGKGRPGDWGPLQTRSNEVQGCSGSSDGMGVESVAGKM